MTLQDIIDLLLAADAATGSPATWRLPGRCCWRMNWGDRWGGRKRVRWSETDYQAYLRRGQPAPIREQAFQAAVMQLAKQYGWMAYHTFDSRKSPSGYPDVTLVHR